MRWIVLPLVLTACAGDFGADRSLPACGTRPIIPPGFDRVRSEVVERPDRAGVRQQFRDGEGRTLVFHIGVREEVPAGLEPAGSIPLATLGTARLSGTGGTWLLAWEEEPPCSEMAVVGRGFGRRRFLEALGFAQVIPFEAEAGEGGAGGESIEEILEEAGEAEGEEGVRPPGGPAAEWVAVFDTARDRGDLDPDQAELADAAPANAVVARASCWRGLPKRLGVPRHAFVAAVRAAAEHELDFAVERVDRTPVARGAFRIRCPA